MIDIKRNRYLEPIAEEWLSNVKKFFNTIRRPYIIQGAKRKYFNSYASKLRYECLSEIFNNTNDKKQRKVYVTVLYYWWKHIDNIILGSPDYLETLVTRWDNKKNGSIILQKILKDILTSYYDKISGEYGLDLVNKLNIKTCPYCNRQFIYTFKGQSYERPELDHFYSKAAYPLLCLSFYNLIPACHSCNHVKLEEKLGLSPYSRAFNTKFAITDKSGARLTKSKIFRLTENEIKLDFYACDAKEDVNIRVLGLKEVYNKHTDYVKELVDKSMAYDAHARNVLVESFQSVGYHPRQVYDFVWGRYLMEAKYEDRPLSKLTKDILDLLDISRG